MITLQPTTFHDVDTALSIIRQGQQHLKNQGIDQWQNGYPDRARLEQDVREQIGYLVMDGTRILGYLCIVFTGEPAYEQIEGKWLTDGSYAVIHRIAFSEAARGQGLSAAVFHLAEDFCRKKNIPALRIDTHADNHKMQHVLDKCGFTFCGIVTYASGLRRAYEKLL